MAIIKLLSSSCGAKVGIDYVTDKEKTEDKLISGKDCMPESAVFEFNEVKKQFHKSDGRTYYHLIQSFAPEDDITPEEAHKVGCMMADIFDGHQVLVATHINKAHIHNHLIINSVNFENGRKLTVSNEDLENIKEYSNQICIEYGWTVTEAKTRRNQNDRWKQRIIKMAIYAMQQNSTMEGFIDTLNYHGISVAYNPEYKYMTYTDEYGHKCRDSKLFDERLLKTNLELYFDLGGSDSILNGMILDYQTPLSGNCTYGLTGTILDLLANFSANTTDDYDDGYAEDSNLLDKIVEKMRMHGIKISKGQLAYIRNFNQNDDQDFGLFM